MPSLELRTTKMNILLYVQLIAHSSFKLGESCTMCQEQPTQPKECQKSEVRCKQSHRTITIISIH